MRWKKQAKEIANLFIDEEEELSLPDILTRTNRSVSFMALHLWSMEDQGLILSKWIDGPLLRKRVYYSPSNFLRA